MTSFRSSSYSLASSTSVNSNPTSSTGSTDSYKTDQTLTNAITEELYQKVQVRVPKKSTDVLTELLKLYTDPEIEAIIKDDALTLAMINDGLKRLYDSKNVFNENQKVHALWEDASWLPATIQKFVPSENEDNEDKWSVIFDGYEVDGAYTLSVRQIRQNKLNVEVESNFVNKAKMPQRTVNTSPLITSRQSPVLQPLPIPNHASVVNPLISPNVNSFQSHLQRTPSPILGSMQAPVYHQNIANQLPRQQISNVQYNQYFNQPKVLLRPQQVHRPIQQYHRSIVYIHGVPHIQNIPVQQVPQQQFASNRMYHFNNVNPYQRQMRQ